MKHWKSVFTQRILAGLNIQAFKIGQCSFNDFFSNKNPPKFLSFSLTFRFKQSKCYVIGNISF